MNETINTTSGMTGSSGLPPIVLFFISLQQIIFFLACTGNGLVIFVFIKYLKFKSNTNKFIVSLSVADCFTGFASFIQVFYFMYPEIAKNKYVCFLRYNIISVMTLVSQLTVTLAALDRYIAICHPHSYSKWMTKKTSNILCVLPWIISIFDLLPFFGWNNWFPGIPCSYTRLFPKMWYGTSCIFIFSAATVTFLMYYFILRSAWRYHNKVKTGNAGESSKKMQKDIKSAKVTGIVTIVFSLCWLPYKAVQIRDAISTSGRSPLLTEIGNWLAFLGIFNSIVNPIIYAWKRPDFKRQCKKIFTCSQGQTVSITANLSSTGTNNEL